MRVFGISVAFGVGARKVSGLGWKSGFVVWGELSF